MQDNVKATSNISIDTGHGYVDEALHVHAMRYVRVDEFHLVKRREGAEQFYFSCEKKKIFILVPPMKTRTAVNYIFWQNAVSFRID